MQCISANGVPSARMVCTVRSISSGVDMPVETIIGLPLRAMCRCSGRCRQLARAGLERRHADRFEKIGRFARKRRRQKDDALALAARSRSSKCASRDSAVRVSRSNSDSPTYAAVAPPRSISCSGKCVWNLIASAPAAAAASTSSAASFASPLWLMPASAMTKHGRPSPICRPAMVMCVESASGPHGRPSTRSDT